MPSGLVYLNYLDMFFSCKGVSGQFLLLPFFIKKKKSSVFSENTADPDQTLRSVASDLDLHYLTMSRL